MAYVYVITTFMIIMSWLHLTSSSEPHTVAVSRRNYVVYLKLIELAHFASHRCGPSSIPGLGRGRMCEKFHQLLAVGRWFPLGTPVSSTRILISSSSFHRLDMTLAVAEALNPNELN